MGPSPDARFLMKRGRRQGHLGRQTRDVRAMARAVARYDDASGVGRLAVRFQGYQGGAQATWRRLGVIRESLPFEYLRILILPTGPSPVHRHLLCGDCPGLTRRYAACEARDEDFSHRSHRHRKRAFRGPPPVENHAVLHQHKIVSGHPFRWRHRIHRHGRRDALQDAAPNGGKRST